MFINMKLGDVTEPKAVPAGRYGLTVTTAEKRNAKEAGKGDNIEVNIGIDGHLDAPNVRHFISLPHPNDDPKKANFKMLMLKRFLVQFGIPHNDDGFAVEDFAGATAQGELGLSDPEESKSGDIYNRLKLDRLPTEGK